MTVDDLAQLTADLKEAVKRSGLEKLGQPSGYLALECS